MGLAIYSILAQLQRLRGVAWRFLMDGAQYTRVVI